MTGSADNRAIAPAAGTPILAKGHGTVTAIDKGAGTITLAHGPIPEAKWPAMTMAFKAAPAIAATAQVGEKVDFDLKLTGSAGEVTALTKQPCRHRAVSAMMRSAERRVGETGVSKCKSRV